MHGILLLQAAAKAAVCTNKSARRGSYEQVCDTTARLPVANDIYLKGAAVTEPPEKHKTSAHCNRRINSEQQAFQSFQ